MSRVFNFAQAEDPARNTFLHSLDFPLRGVCVSPRALRAVSVVETPVDAANVVTAAASGDQRDLLVALRARIARDIDSDKTPARDLAALSRRLLEIAKEIRALDAATSKDDVGQAAEVPDEKFAAS